MLDSVFAYVDPGISATILQVVLAGTVGIGALVKLRWQNIKKVVGRANEPSIGDEKTTEHSQ